MISSCDRETVHPQSGYNSEKGWLLNTEEIRSYSFRNYTAHDFKALLEDAHVPFGTALYDTIKEVPMFEADLGVDVYCIHGTNQTTPYQFR